MPTPDELSAAAIEQINAALAARTGGGAQAAALSADAVGQIDAALQAYDGHGTADALPVDNGPAAVQALQANYPVPAPVSPPAAMIGGAGAELPPASVSPPGASQAPQSGISFQAPAAPQAAAPKTEAQLDQEAMEAALADKPLTNEQAARVQRYKSQSPSAQGGGVAFLPTNTTGVSQERLPAEAKAGLARARKYGLAAADAENDIVLAQAEQDRAVVDAVTAQANEHVRQAQAIDQLNVQREEAMTKVMADVTAKRSAWQSVANEEFKSKRGPAYRVAASIAAGLGAFGAALTHSQNWAQQTLDAAYEREYDEWKRGIAAKRDDVTLSQQILNETSNMFKDKMAAKLVSKGAWLEAAASNVEKASYLNKDKIGQAKSAQTALQIRQAAEQHYADGMSRERTAYQTGSSVAPVSLGGSGSGKEQNALTDYTQRTEAVSSGRKAFGQVTDKDQDEAADVRKSVLATQPIIVNARKLLAMAEKFNVGNAVVSSTEIKRQYNAMREALFSPIVKDASGAGVSNEEYKRRTDAAFATDAIDPGMVKAALMPYVGILSEINRSKVEALHPDLVEQNWERLTRTLGKEDADMIRNGGVPSAEASKKQAEAAGMSNVR